MRRRIGKAIMVFAAISVLFAVITSYHKYNMSFHMRTLKTIEKVASGLLEISKTLTFTQLQLARNQKKIFAMIQNDLYKQLAPLTREELPEPEPIDYPPDVAAPPEN